MLILLTHSSEESFRIRKCVIDISNFHSGCQQWIQLVSATIEHNYKKQLVLCLLKITVHCTVRTYCRTPKSQLSEFAFPKVMNLRDKCFHVWIPGGKTNLKLYVTFSNWIQVGGFQEDGHVAHTSTRCSSSFIVYAKVGSDTWNDFNPASGFRT